MLFVVQILCPMKSYKNAVINTDIKAVIFMSVVLDLIVMSLRPTFAISTNITNIRDHRLSDKENR